MKEIEITLNNSDSIKLAIRKMMNDSYNVLDYSFEASNSSNRGIIKVYLGKVNNPSNFLSYSLNLQLNGLASTAGFDVYLIERKDNGDEIRTHQEMGINIEKPFKEGTVS